MKTLAFALSLATALSALQAASLSVEVVEGDGAIHNVLAKQVTQPVVRVTTAAGEPVQGAAVTFLLPEVGAGARFPSGSTQTIITGEDGVAAGRGMRPNSLPGPWEIRAVASYNGSTARAVLPQTNAVPLEAAGGAHKSRRMLLLGLLAGGAAAGIAVALGGGKSTPQPQSSLAVQTPPPSTILAGTSTIGRP